jgi:hypothetical protein
MELPHQFIKLLQHIYTSRKSQEDTEKRILKEIIDNRDTRLSNIVIG